MHSVMQNIESDVDLWIQALKAKRAGKEATLSRLEWDQLLGRYQACCDVPSAIFSAELAQVYPDAKVIILNRDAESWYQSVLNTVHPAVVIMELGTLYTIQDDNPRSIGIKAIAKARNIDLRFNYVNLSDPAGDHLSASPLGKIPAFIGNDGFKLSECIAIAVYACVKFTHTEIFYVMIMNIRELTSGSRVERRGRKLARERKPTKRLYLAVDVVFQH
ncbi:NAD dependent epimerase/dehydratase [Paramyrothecium foliicola]|nr:NAD dependent epimerase/dehydratase [Paramyrothecium foliicola]